MSAINKRIGKGEHAVSSYEAVFGMKYDESVPCHQSSLQTCRTVEERLQLTDGTTTHLHSIANTHCCVRTNETEDADSDSDVPKYWEDVDTDAGDTDIDSDGDVDSNGDGDNSYNGDDDFSDIDCDVDSNHDGDKNYNSDHDNQMGTTVALFHVLYFCQYSN